MSNDRKNLLIMAVFLIAFEIILSYILPSFLKEDYTNHTELPLLESPEPFLNADLQTDTVFGDTIAKIQVTSNRQMLLCDVRVKGDHSNPVLFSEHDYTAEDSRTTVFNLPAYPPEKLLFTYGTNTSEDAEIQITGIYEDDGFYYLQKIILHSVSTEKGENQ